MSIFNTLLSRTIELFQNHFGSPLLIVRSPGRINLIGEHTDYNLGYVLPASIDKAIYIAISKRMDDEIHLIAGDLSSLFTTRLDSLHFTDMQWPNYILGVVEQMQKMGYTLNGFNAVIAGDIPLGAGLSSSAAVECATTFALNELFTLGLSKLEMVKLSQKAENEFVGVQCGIMDQFASMFGKKDQLIRLDCRSLEYAYIPFQANEYQIVLFDTGVKHSLDSTEYNLRRQECEQGVSIIQSKYRHVSSLRDVSKLMMNDCLVSASKKIVMRCTYIVEEIERLQNACIDLLNHDFTSFGKKMFETHDGLSHLYEVSCLEADLLVALVRNNSAVVGARMMGGGFGGCTINIVKKEQTESLIHSVTKNYVNQVGRELQTYLVSIDEGTSLI